MRDGFGGIDDAAAAHAQQKISAKRNSLPHALPRQGKTRIRLYTAHSLKGQARSRELALQTGQQAALHRTAAAINHKYPAAAVFLYFLRGLLLRFPPKDDFGWTMVLKALHVLILLYGISSLIN